MSHVYRKVKAVHFDQSPNARPGQGLYSLQLECGHVLKVNCRRPIPKRRICLMCSALKYEGAVISTTTDGVEITQSWDHLKDRLKIKVKSDNHTSEEIRKILIEAGAKPENFQ